MPTPLQIYLGGNGNQTRLADLYFERVKIKDVEKTLEPLFFWWKQSRREGEGFGDFCARHGKEAIKEYAQGYLDQDQQVSTQVRPRRTVAETRTRVP